MPSPLRLDLAFTKGYKLPQRCRVKSAGTPVFLKPSRAGVNWLILSGVILHITGTDTQVFVRVEQSDGIVIKEFVIPAACGSGTYPMGSFFQNKDATADQQTKTEPWTPVILEGGADHLYVNGDVNAGVDMHVLEWLT